MAVATKRTSQKHANLARMLRTKRDELLDHIRDHREAVVAERVPEDDMGLASRSLLEDLAVGTIQREKQLLGEVEHALQRLNRGEYGVCERCGEEIPKRRLEALPWTRECLKCAERRQAILRN